MTQVMLKSLTLAYLNIFKIHLDKHKLLLVQEYICKFISYNIIIWIKRSPERIGFEKKYDSKCDIWSLGLVLWELATGKPLPYTSNSK